MERNDYDFSCLVNKKPEINIYELCENKYFVVELLNTVLKLIQDGIKAENQNEDIQSLKDRFEVAIEVMSKHGLLDEFRDTYYERLGK